jgi:hypothetical protein
MPLGWLHRGHVGSHLSSMCSFNLMNLNFLVSSCNFLCFRSHEESFGQLKSRCVPAPPLSICFLMHEARSEAHAQIEKVAVDCIRHPCNTIHHIKIHQGCLFRAFHEALAQNPQLKPIQKQLLGLRWHGRVKPVMLCRRSTRSRSKT